jgi:vacuolar-type H+-ATPase subunit F/Vma7
MGHLIVLTTRELEPGYRLAGVATRALDSPDEAAERLSELLDQLGGGDGDVIAVHEPFFDELPGALRRRIDSLASPLVVALPGGEDAYVEAERRAQHLRILWAAVGYQITFEREGDSA